MVCLWRSDSLVGIIQGFRQTAIAGLGPGQKKDGSSAASPLPARKEAFIHGRRKEYTIVSDHSTFILT